MNWITNGINRMRNWWNNNHNKIIPALDRGITRIGNNIVRLAAIGIILNLVSVFYPELPERFPVIYDWFDGWLQLCEFALKGSLGFIYSLFTGDVVEFWAEYTDAFKTLWQQFVDWLSSLHF